MCKRRENGHFTRGALLPVGNPLSERTRTGRERVCKWSSSVYKYGLACVVSLFCTDRSVADLPITESYFRPAARLFGLENEIAIPVLVLSWVGGYAVCAKVVGDLRKNRLLNARDAALVVLLGCCSSPGFVDRLRRWLADGKCAAGHPFLLACSLRQTWLLPHCVLDYYRGRTAQSVSPKATVPRIAFFLQRHRQCGRKLFAGMRLRAVFPHDRMPYWCRFFLKRHLPYP